MAYTETRIAELEAEVHELANEAERLRAELAKANFNAEVARHNHESEARELRAELAKAREALLSRARAALQLEEKKG